MHAAAVIGYWLLLLGFFGEFGTQQGQENGLLPIIFLAWIAWGTWRLVRKYALKRPGFGETPQPTDQNP